MPINNEFAKRIKAIPTREKDLKEDSVQKTKENNGVAAEVASRGKTDAKKRKKVKGMSLWELILAIAITAVVSAAAIVGGAAMLHNSKVSTTISEQESMASALKNAMFSEPSLVRLFPDTSLTERAASTSKFFAKLNNYMDDNSKIVYYDGTAPKTGDGLTVEGLQSGAGHSGYYLMLKDKWDMHYKLEVHSDDNALTGQTFQTVASSGLARPTTFNKVSAPGTAAKNPDTEMRLYIRSCGANGASLPDAFTLDNDDIITMLQYVNSQTETATLDRRAPKVTNARFASGGNTGATFSVSELAAKVVDAAAGVTDTASKYCLYNKTSIDSEIISIRSAAIYSVVGGITT